MERVAGECRNIFETKRGFKTIDAQSDSDRLYAESGQIDMALDWLKKSLRSTCNGVAAMGGDASIHRGQQAVCADEHQPLGDLSATKTKA